MKDILTLDNERLQSQVISFLRFPLIVCVILIHTQITNINNVVGDMSAPYPYDGVFPIFETVFYLCAQILSRIAVPLFFMFSGFLFFYKIKCFTAKIYINKLKKRIRTLLIPYLFWNILFVVFYNVSGLLFPGATETVIGEGYTIKDWMMLLWCRDNTYYPVSYQFWFIRDLMVIVLLTPLIFFLTKKLNYFFPLIIGLLWLLGCGFNIIELGVEALFFFVVGAYFSITHKNFVIKVKPYVTILGILYFLCVIITFYTKSLDWSVYMKRISIFIGVVFAIALAATNIAKGKWTVNSLLSDSSFFIFAYHIIALPIIRRVLFWIIPCSSDIRAVFLYFLWATVGICIGLILYYFMKQRLPKVLALITGGR